MSQRIRILQEFGEQLERTLGATPRNGKEPRREQWPWSGQGDVSEPDHKTASRRRGGFSVADDEARRQVAAGRRIGGGGFAAILAATVTLVIAVGTLASVGERHGAPKTSGASTTVNPTIVSDFAAFRRPRTPSDAVPDNLNFECAPPGALHGVMCDIDQPHFRSPGLHFPSLRLSAAEKPVTGKLQLDQSRRFALPGGLGVLWLIPAGKWLCGLIRIPSLDFSKSFPGTMWCEDASRVLAHPPLAWPGYSFPSPHHSYLIAIEPDRIARATIVYPGGREPTILHQGLLLACVGMGPYDLVQTTNTGRTLNSIRVGGGGAFRPVSCPQFHQSAGVQPTTAPANSPSRSRNAIVEDCLSHGQLTRSYTAEQLRRALAVLPATVKQYTNCPNVINQALHGKG